MSIFDQAARAARRLGPLGGATARGIELYGEAFELTERTALKLLRSRLDSVAPAQLPAPKAETTNGHHPDPAQLMTDLLESSLRQDTEASQRDVYIAILRQLVPDEARIIAALAEGPPAPLVHVLPRAGGERILENASLIGRTAAVTLPSMTPTYVTHLRQLGIVETGPEDTANKRGYELLMADREVRAALKEGELGKLPARTLRRTLTLSAHGRALWDACAP